MFNVEAAYPCSFYTWQDKQIFMRIIPLYPILLYSEVVSTATTTAYEESLYPFASRPILFLSPLHPLAQFLFSSFSGSLGSHPLNRISHNFPRSLLYRISPCQEPSMGESSWLCITVSTLSTFLILMSLNVSTLSTFLILILSYCNNYNRLSLSASCFLLI